MSELTDKALAKLQALASMRSGDGVNDYLLSVCNHIRHDADSAIEAKAIVLPYLQQARAGRSMYEIEAELNRQIETAYRGFIKGADNLGTTHEAKPKWPSVDKARVELILRDGLDLSNLFDISPVRLPDNDDSYTEYVIDELFSDNPLLCVGNSNHSFDTKRRDSWRGELSSKQFIVPSPYKTRTSLTKDGQRESAHTLEGVGDRKFIIIEFDQYTTDEQATIIWHLERYLDLALVVHSGRRSLHGWFYCAGFDEADGAPLHRFKRLAKSLGACHGPFTKSQFVRMPDGTRDTGERQSVVYFNPEVVK
jgi:hypothetical protein